jgi:YebC/PmpR family DNA-binding regulatory protein
MSGHSKWSKIKRAKGAQDKKRGKIFTRAIHDITTAVREGGGPDPDGNARLRLAIDKARAVNMPSDNIDRAIKRASGEGKGSQAAEVVYEGYGPGGTAVLVETLTDNKNRTVGEIRHAFSRHAGSLGENGCVAWMFTKKGLLVIKKEAAEEEELMEFALEGGADDVSDEGDIWEVTCDPGKFLEVKANLEKRYSFEEAEVQMLPNSTQKLSGKEAEQAVKLVDALEDLDDVMSVATNCDFEDDYEGA